MNSFLVKIGLILVIGLYPGGLLALDKEEKAAIQAIKAGDMQFLESYLTGIADKNCAFSNGKTGLYYAISFDNFDAAFLLLNRGADPELMVAKSSTMHWAIRFNRPRLVRLLIEFGADVNRQDSKQNTPLIYAAELNNEEICKVLVDRGADPLHVNANRKRAGDYAYNYPGSAAYKYLAGMEQMIEGLDSVPSLQDGPYMIWESDSRVVMTYFERNHEKNLTRIIEKTFYQESDTIVADGIAWDRNSYHISLHHTPNPEIIQTNSHIFVVGDIHGKFQALLFLLHNNGVINKEKNWIFGEGHLVLLGDVFDRGSYVTEVLWFLHELQVQAKKAGGNVHLLLGNHEMMAMTRDTRYLNSKYEYFTRFIRVHYADLYERNTELGRWLRSQNALLQLNGYLFSHAGISPELADSAFSIAEVNETIRNFLGSDYTTEDGSKAELILGSVGPQWYRGYGYFGGDEPEVSAEFVEQFIAANGLKGMVIGHNEQQSIKSDFGGKVISADVALDESGHSAQGLLISGNEIFRCYSDGKREPLE